MVVSARYSTVIVGCGYVGQRLLKRLPEGAALGLSRRQPELIEHALGIDLDHDPLSALLDVVDGAVMYYFVAPSISSLQDDRSRRLIHALTNSRAKPASIVLISTTGVYGDCAGEWVNEERALQPAAARSRRRVDAERVWAEYCKVEGVALAILRVAGIYGPGKLPKKRLSSGQPLLLESQSPYSNRVHVEDLIDTAQAVAGHDGVFNVADGFPSTMTAYFHVLADVLGVERLPEASREELIASWSDGLRSYMSESRRIDNTRMRAFLGGALRYSNLQAGLEDCLKQEIAGQLQQ